MFGIKSNARQIVDLYYRFQRPSIWETKWGPKLYIDPSNQYERGVAKGTVETEELSFFCNMVEQKEFEQFADVGSFIGMYSLAFADHSRGNVDAFEPVPWNAGRLSRNLVINGYEEFEVHQTAVSDTTGETSLIVNPDFSAEASILEETYSGGDTYSLDVPTVTLDKFYENRQRPDLLKIDTEGAETSVLEGAQDVLSHRPTIFIELHQSLLDRPESALRKIEGTLSEVGYLEAYHLESGRTFEIDQLETLSEEKGISTHLLIE